MPTDTNDQKAIITNLANRVFSLETQIGPVRLLLDRLEKRLEDSLADKTKDVAPDQDVTVYLWVGEGTRCGHHWYFNTQRESWEEAPTSQDSNSYMSTGDFFCEVNPRIDATFISDKPPTLVDELPPWACA